MQKRPAISIIIPVYNAAHFLPACLQSAVLQCPENSEIIAVDDGSTDTSAQVLTSLTSRYAHLRVITQPNQGPAAARQTGVKASSGEYILFLDADDVLPADYAAQLLKKATQTKADLVLAAVARWNGQTPVPSAPGGSWFSSTVLQGAQKAVLFEDFDVVMPLYGKLIARHLLEQITDWGSAYRNGEDIPVSVALLACAEKIALVPTTCYIYRLRENSQSRERAGQFAGLLDGFLRARQELKNRGVYSLFARGFEYVCRVCLTSFMETYGLTQEEETRLAHARAQLTVPRKIWHGRPWRFRVRQYGFELCLKYGFSYARLVLWARRVYGRGRRSEK
ncbi:MAG: glycosyltransferase [Elusimicrobiaceae bacterium]|nr:glycosyltransferase [Elusimicrobiaceae bacterium]